MLGAARSIEKTIYSIHGVLTNGKEAIAKATKHKATSKNISPSKRGHTWLYLLKLLPQLRPHPRLKLPPLLALCQRPGCNYLAVGHILAMAFRPGACSTNKGACTFFGRTGHGVLDLHLHGADFGVTLEIALAISNFALVAAEQCCDREDCLLDRSDTNGGKAGDGELTLVPRNR